MMNQYERICVLDMCDVERTRKDEIYQKGTVYLQVSATHGAIEITEEATELEPGKYVIFKPKSEINTEYLRLVLEMAMPEFMQKYMTGINIQVDQLKYLFINWHINEQDQAKVVAMVKEIEKDEKLERQLLEEYKTLKRITLNGMMV